MVDNKFLPELSENLLEILDENQHYDIIIEVGNDPHIRKFRAHTLILNYRSPYFREILSTDKKKSKSDEHIKLPNISPEIFQIILRYIYGGKLSFGECNDSADII
ncbi:BTB/POZ protein, partial [Rhizophagus irregularis DAOM 181602=DAOM 197198]